MKQRGPRSMYRTIWLVLFFGSGAARSQAHRHQSEFLEWRVPLFILHAHIFGMICRKPERKSS